MKNPYNPITEPSSYKWFEENRVAVFAGQETIKSNVKQELSELKEKYEQECVKSEALFMNSQSQHETFNAMYRKYEKLKEAFMSVLNSSTDFLTISAMQKQTVKDYWLKEAGLKED